MAQTTFTTPKGSKIDLLKLKGKDYMLVVHRVLWMNEEIKSFTIDTNFLKLEETYSVCRAAVSFYDENGRVVKQATATKKETAKDFPDFVEKSETSAIGRALSLMGFGTAQSLADFDEGNRLADAPVSAPVVDVKQDVRPVTQQLDKALVATTPPTAVTNVSSFKKNTFKKPAKTAPVVETTAKSATNDGWE